MHPAWVWLYGIGGYSEAGAGARARDEHSRVPPRTDMIPRIAKAFTVTAVWDSYAEVFATKSDIPGLVVEAATFEESIDLIGSLAPEVIAVRPRRADTL